MALYSWEEMARLKIQEPEFYLNPYIVKEGVTLLWGKSSIGKSPLTWEMAAAIGRGGHFFGLPTKQGRVLYIDVDSPENLLAGRLAKKPVAPDVWFMILKPLGIPNVPKEIEGELREAQRDIKPDVVFLNTLRKLHSLDDKESSTPVAVYSYFQHLFPQAAIVVVHHPRKRSTDPRMKEIKTENFSGSGHWIDDAQVGLYLEKYRDPAHRFNIRLNHVKGQGSSLIKPLPLLLSKEDGATLTCPIYEDHLVAYELVNEWLGKVSLDILDQKIGDAIGLSKSSGRRVRLGITDGGFPKGRGWMSYAPGEQEAAEEEEDE